MIKTQLLFYWIAVGLYAISSVFFIVGLFFKKNLQNKAIFLTVFGFLANSVALILRWKQTGHFPYYGMYEVLPTYAWGFILFFLITQYFKPALRFLGSMLLPLAFIMIGIGILGSTEIKEIPRTFFTFWLGVHIAFANLSYGSALISATLGVVYLFKCRTKVDSNNQTSPHSWFSRFPSLEKIDDLSYNFAAFAFFMMAIMIVSGAVWANNAWGRYWGWDPIETWSLISWLVYGLTLHLYRTGLCKKQFIQLNLVVHKNVTFFFFLIEGNLLQYIELSSLVKRCTFFNIRSKFLQVKVFN